MKKRKTKNRRQKLIKECDQLISWIVKLKRSFRCEYCKKAPEPRGLHAHHIFKKGHYLSVRWDEDNLLVLCYHCHRFIAHSSDIHTLITFKEWVEEHLGSRYKDLQKRAIKVTPVKTFMLEALKEELEKQLWELAQKNLNWIKHKTLAQVIKKLEKKYGENL